MNAFSKSLIVIPILTLMANPAFAIDTTQTYSSGILVGMFLAFCALVVVMQLIPTIMLLVGFVKGLSRENQKQAGQSGSKA